MATKPQPAIDLPEQTISAARTGRGGKRVPGPGKKLGQPPGSRNRMTSELAKLGDGVHRLKWKQTTESSPRGRGGRRPGSGAKPTHVPILPPWRIPEYLSRGELIELLRQAKEHRERDWLMILVAAWHGLSASDVTTFTPEAVQSERLTITRVKSGKTTTQPLVRHKDPLLDERRPLIDFIRRAPAGKPVFNVTRQTFWNLMQKYGQLGGIPPSKATARALKHSITIQTLISRDVSPNTPVNKGGRPKGMTRATLDEARLLEEHLHEFEKAQGSKRGGMEYACRKVYGSIDLRKAIARANKTLAKYGKLSRRNESAV